ncbi:hypothetical protein BH11PSE11_BH11PSE11_05070 [soil metagenome]
MAQAMSNLSSNVDNKVTRVTILKKNADGSRVIVPVYDELTTKLAQPNKKQTGAYKVLGKKTRKGALRGLRILEIYLALHERSNKKKKNGAARDLFKNSIKAMRKSSNDD